mmetsp:Transcript_16859/g.26313  ORF Transcript_16859/g.26313 Transcript_16859/m.26313 type:complete len:214 (-) Transcript_16859:283-924(-)|eukprot:CAMPEP_0196805260 /NCGR_PEP_ID=MMETSP1362-20130617/5038_1 /TAXON_ID=163516 /ORGANISM="Leptocylindrus danicus, Strain CCMP1856" /LENGTH=213 /DNA_ID=CAMNT_0042178093 /DNA_START=77 /DNA_END=718 /DNA_ORIENTATION=-
MTIKTATACTILLAFLASTTCITYTDALSSNKHTGKRKHNTLNRADFLRETLVAATASGIAVPSIAQAAATEEKMTNLSNADLAAILTRDVAENQFLVSADITRAIYDEGATFTDEIDTYTMDKWIIGTKRLFVAEKSRVSLVGDVQVSDDGSKAEFRFDEDLMFRIPFLYPVVSLTGKVVLERDVKTGLITSYREFWDQDVATVLKGAKFRT